MSLSNYLNDFDTSLEVMSDSNKKMLYVSVFVLVVLIPYYFFGLGLQEDAAEKEKVYLGLQEELSASKVKTFETKVKKLDQQILEDKSTLEQAQYQNRSLQSRLAQIDYLSSDAKGLASMLERVLKESVRLGVSIEKISMDDTPKTYKAQIEQLGMMQIEGQANFRSVVKLMRYIEQQEMLLEIGSVAFSLEEDEKTPHFSLVVNGYGVRL